MSEKVFQVQDDHGNWYVIPFELRRKFFDMQDGGHHDHHEAFHERFSEYLTEGDPNNVESGTPTPAPLTYTPAQVIEMVRKAWDWAYKKGYNDRADEPHNMRIDADLPMNYQQLLTTLGLSVPGDKM